MDDPVLRATSGVIARDGEGRVLLMRRSDDGNWGMPGGGVELGESWEQAAVRECWEETGWRVAVDDLLGIYSEPGSQLHQYPTGRVVQFLGVVFLGTVLEPDPAALLDGEATDVGFFSLDDLPRPFLPADLPALQDAPRFAGRPFIR